MGVFGVEWGAFFVVGGGGGGEAQQQLRLLRRAGPNAGARRASYLRRICCVSPLTGLRGA